MPLVLEYPTAEQVIEADRERFAMASWHAWCELRECEPPAVSDTDAAWKDWLVDYNRLAEAMLRRVI